MFGVKKLKILVWSVTISSVLVSCNEEQSLATEIHGETQGTTYTIILSDGNPRIEKSQIDSIFHVFDLSLSTYIDSSVISQLNNCEESITISDESFFLRDCYQQSQEIFALSEGAFDPSVFPLVKGWGFMNNMETPLSQAEVDSILTFVSFEADEHHSILFSNSGNAEISYTKNHPNFKLDFNAIAQGLSVDVIDKFLKEKGCENYYVEIGGEIIVRGVNVEGNKWRIGVDTPVENLDTRELENIIHISDKGIATSGNYRKFYIHDGNKYAHTLNPKTGFPAQHSLLSATVVTDECSKADAYATVFMVMGVEKTMEFVENHPQEKLEVYLLYSDTDGSIKREMSSGFEKYLKE